MEIKDYLHLYLNSGVGCFVFTDESITDGFLDKYIKEYPSGVYAPVLNFDNYHRFLKDGYKPILRRLSSMTDEEREQLNDIELGESSWPTVAYALAPCFKWMLSKGFDLFGLIDAGLAIDKQTIKT